MSRNKKICELEIFKKLDRVFFGFRLGLGLGSLGDTVGGPVLVETWSVKVLPGTKQTCFVCHHTYTSVVRERTCQQKRNFRF